MKGGFHLKRRMSHGFTVIEVLIVLAVTGMLFVSAAVMISGRQRQTAFNTSIREVQSQIQQTLNEVSTGFYPNQGNFQCTASGGAPNITTGTAEQGTNSDCIFLGKVIQFGLSGTDPEEMITYTVAGLRLRTGSTSEVTTLVESRPTTLLLGGTADGTESRVLKNGLTTAWVRYNNGAATLNVGAVGFVSTLASYSSGSIVSGSQQVNLVPIRGTALNQSKTTAASNITNDLRSATAVVNPTNGVTICFASAGTNQSGLVTIGGNNRQLSVKLDIKGNTTCA